MQTTADLFNSSIKQYQTLINRNTDLCEQIASLSVEEVLKECEALRELQKEQSKVDAFIIEVMKDTGHEILAQPYVREYQNIITQAKSSCDDVTEKALTIRAMLKEEINKLNLGQKGLAGYNSGSQEKTSLNGSY